MRIAILGSKGIPGRHGVEVVVENISSRLADLGHSVSIFGYSTYFEGLDYYKNCKLIPLKGSINKYLEMPSHAINAAKTIHRQYKNSFDVLHIHSSDTCLFLSSLKKYFPTVATSHSRTYLRSEIDPIRKISSKIAEKYYLSAGDVLTGVSPIDVDYYNSVNHRLKGKVRYIPNGLPITSCDLPLSEEFGIEPGSYILFSAGRIIPSKGLHTLLEAYANLKISIPLVVVGDRGFNDSYYDHVRKIAPENTIWLGFLTGDALHGVYQNAKFAVFPSLYEAQSMTLLEFLGFGVYVVYSDLPENTAVTQGLGTSFVAGSSQSLSQAISYVLENNPSVKIENRDKVVEIHNWDVITKQYLQAYKNAIAHRA